MTQGSSPLPYDPVSFKRMHLNPQFCRVNTRQNPGGTLLIEVLCNNKPVMAFLYQWQKEWMIRQRLQTFSKLLGDTVMPSPIQVTELPQLPCRKVASELCEHLFWSNADLVVCVPPEKDGSATIEIRTAVGVLVASFAVNGYTADDDVVLEAAVRLKERLQTHSKVRVESLWESERIVWYV